MRASFRCGSGNGVAVVERVAALGAELRRVGRVFRLPAALVAFESLHGGRARSAALGAEFALVHRAARARPALVRGLGLAAVAAELAGVAGLTAGARPAIGRRRCRRGGGLRRGLRRGNGLLRRLLGCLLLTHGVEILGVDAAHLTGHAHAHERHGRARGRVGRGGLHRLALRAREHRGGARRVHVGGLALHLLDHLLVFLVRLHGRDAEGHDLKTAAVAPLRRELLVERLGDLARVTGQRRVADAHVADARERRLQRREQFALELTVDRVAGVGLGDVGADVGVKQQRVRDAVAVLAEAADGDVDVDAGALIDHAERHRARRAVLVAGQLLGVEVIDALILRCFAAEGEALADVLEHLTDARAEVSGEDRRLGGRVVGVLARLGADLDDLALLDDEHTLTVGDRDARAGGDDVLIAVRVARTAGGFLLSLDRQHVGRQRLAGEKFLPLVGHDTAGSSGDRFDKSHKHAPLRRCFSSDLTAFDDFSAMLIV